MTYYQDEQEIKLKEDTSHARRGCCLGLIVIPPILLCICWAVLTFTPNGQVALAWAVLYMTHDGLPIHDVAQGFPGLARLSCQLDRQDPRPANYQQLQDNLDQLYSQMVQAYGDAWYELNSAEADLSEYEEPDQIPSNLAGGKITYCR
jgi:hypothetical protein